MKCNGAVAWAAFEMPKGGPTRYRAGIDFGSDAPGIEHFAEETQEGREVDYRRGNHFATTLSPRMMVSWRSEPVEINPTGTPLTSSNRRM